MLDDNPEILFDLEAEGVQVDGMSIGQIKKLRLFYADVHPWLKEKVNGIRENKN